VPRGSTMADLGIREDASVLGSTSLLHGLTAPEFEGSIECTACHDPHDRLDTRPDPELIQPVCEGCHQSIMWMSSDHRGVPCLGCHRIHAAEGPKLLAEPSMELTCNRCHDAASVPPPDTDFGGSTDPTSAMAFSVMADLAPQAHERRAETGCLACHPQHAD
jgi:predicted CXXCH cytochrome family protein